MQGVVLGHDSEVEDQGSDRKRFAEQVPADNHQHHPRGSNVLLSTSKHNPKLSKKKTNYSPEIRVVLLNRILSIYTALFARLKLLTSSFIKCINTLF